MGAFDDLDDAGGLAEMRRFGLAEMRRFGHSLQVDQLVESLVTLVNRQINRLYPATTVEEEEEEEERRLKLVEGIAAQLYLVTETRKEDEVFRKKVIRQMVKIIENAIRSVSVPGNEKIKQERLSLGLDGVIELQIYRAAFQISKRRWVRAVKGNVVSLKRESLATVDHEVAKLEDKLEITEARLFYAKEQCARLKEENENKEKRCAELVEELAEKNRASDKKHGDLLTQCAELEKENENKEKRCVKLVEELAEKNRASDKKHGDLLKRCAELEKENENKEKRCAELEGENRHLKRGDSPEDGDLAGPNSVSPSNSGLQVGPQDPAERATVRVETTPAPTGAECSEIIKVLKKVMKLADTVISLAVSLLLGLLTLHRSVEPQAPAYKAFKFCIFVTFACGLSMSLLTICDFHASYKMQIIRGLVYATRGFQVLSGVCVCIAFMKAIDLLAFVPVIVVVIVACIIVYYKDSRSSGQSRRRNRGLLP